MSDNATYSEFVGRLFTEEIPFSSIRDLSTEELLAALIAWESMCNAPHMSVTQMIAESVLDDVKKIRAEIDKLEDVIEKIQDEVCKHPNVIKTSGFSTVGYDLNSDRYWYDYDCPDCGKYWRVEQ